MTDLADLLSRSDIVTLHCAATPENHHLINRAICPLMKLGAVLVNTARARWLKRRRWSSA